MRPLTTISNADVDPTIEGVHTCLVEGEGSPKLIDFGVVRATGLEDAPPADIPGTAAYMAPEMFDGEPGSEATDIYALGVTMFRAVTGEYSLGNADATRERPVPLSALRPDLPACP